MTALTAEIDIPSSSADEEDDTSGLYLNAGIVWRLGKHFNVGLEGRTVVSTDLTLFDTATDADYYQFTLLIGGGW